MAGKSKGTTQRINEIRFLYIDPDPMGTTDAEVLEAALAGGLEAQLRWESRQVFKLMTALRDANMENREEAVNDAFYAWWALGPNAARKIEKPLNWLITSASRKTIDRMRHLREEKKALVDNKGTDKVLDAAFAEEDERDREAELEHDHKVQAVVRTYDGMEQAVYDLLERWGRSYAEVEFITGIPQGDSTTGLMNIMKRIREALAAKGLSSKPKQVRKKRESP